jgi:ABC-2 type transport system permease protein
MPIFDQGYQHWNGQLTSQLWRWWAVTRNGIRMQLRSKLTRFSIATFLAPALALTAFIILWSLFEQGNAYIKPLIAIMLPKELIDVPQDYRVAVWTLAFHFFFMVQYTLLMVLILLVGPNLISKDLRFNALPLYFSRPLRRWEYFLGKLGVIAFFVLVVTAAPAVLAWCLGILFSLKFSIIPEVFHLLWGSVLVSVVISLAYGLLMLALSSLSRNSRYVAMMWFGWFLLTNSLCGLLLASTRLAEWSYLASYSMNVQRVSEAILGTESAWQKIDTGYKIARDAQQKLMPQAPLGSDRFTRGRRRGPVNGMVGTIYIPDSKWQNNSFLTQAIIDVAIKDEDKWVNHSTWIRSLYPWTWSACVLLFMGVLSLCILMFRVKSLDRLR